MCPVSAAGFVNKRSMAHQMQKGLAQVPLTLLTFLGTLEPPVNRVLREG